MLLASEVNGLRGIDKPWHLKANYQTFDADGKPKVQGVFEEWWAGPEKWKINYADPTFHQAEYSSGDKDLITGDSGAVPAPESMVEKFLVHPLPNANGLHGQDFSHLDRKIGKNALSCLKLANPPSDNSSLGGVHVDESAYEGLRVAGLQGASRLTCFDPKAPMLRVEGFETGDLYVIFDDIAETNGHYVAKQILVENGDLDIVRVTLTDLEFPPAIGEDISPPASAVAVPTDQSPGIRAGRRIGGQHARYPKDARDNHVRGTVMLQAIISNTGNIEDVQLVSGPSEFRKSAYDAVKTWKFKPFLLNGRPVDTAILVDVSYTPES